MDDLEDAKDVEDHLKEDSRLYPVKHAVDALLPLVVVALITVLYFEFFVHLSDASHMLVIRVEQAILLYFALELLLDLWLYTSNRAFLRHKWLDILLLIPFLTVFRGTLRVLRVLKLVKPAKPLKAAKGAKATKAAKAVKASRLAQAQRAVKQTKTVQKAGKAVKKGKKLVRKHG